MAFQIASAFVDVEADTTSAIRGINQVITRMTTLGPVAMAAGSGVAVAVGGMAAAFASAGAGLGAFTAAVKPQFAEISESVKLYDKAQQAAGEGGKKAAEAQKAYNDALARMPPATRDTAQAFVGLRGDFDKWSDSLASSTMPIFTQGIGILRKILPSLTPLVKATATALGGFMDKIEAAVNGGAVDRFAKKLAEVAGGNLTNLLEGAKNVAKGVGGIISAFLPLSGQLSGGFADMTARFAEWGQGLGQSQGFKAFVDYAKENGPKLLAIVGDLFKALGNIIMALAPFTGAALLLAQAFAQIIANVPTPVLSTLAGIITTLVIAFKLYAMYQAAVTLATTIWTSSIWASTAALLANPMTWVVIAIVALIAVIVLIATKTDWFQTIWDKVWGAITTAFSATVDFLTGLFSTIGDFFTKTIPGWAKDLKDKVVGAWTSMKEKTAEIIAKIVVWVMDKWNGFKTKVQKVFELIKDKISKAWTDAKDKMVEIIAKIVVWVMDKWNGFKTKTGQVFDQIKQKISDAIDKARQAVYDKVAKVISYVTGIKDRVKDALSGAADWLKESGKKIIQGLIDGIKNMAGNVKDAIGNVLSDARDLLPFSPAKEGPFSGKGWTLYSGQSMMTGLAEGIDEKRAIVRSSMEGALSPAQAQTRPGLTSSSVGVPAAAGPSYGDIHVTISARDVAEMKAVHDFFAKIHQTARAGQNKRAVTVIR